MKTKKILFTTSLTAIAVIALLFASCKKNSPATPATSTDDTQQQETSAQDQKNVQNESDGAVDDANTAMGTSVTVNGKAESALYTIITLCGATIDSSVISKGELSITYTGKNCAGTKLRSGNITISLPYDSIAAPGHKITRWRTPGCIMTLTFNQYKVTYLTGADSGKYLILNGSKTITNIKGTAPIDWILHPADSVITTIAGTLSITFDDGTVRSWQTNRTRTLTYTPGAAPVITAQLKGNGSAGGYNNLIFWGTDRANETFYTNVSVPVVATSACLFLPSSGVITQYATRALTITYGVDINGNSVTTGCAYGYKLNWTNAAGTAKQVIRRY